MTQAQAVAAPGAATPPVAVGTAAARQRRREVTRGLLRSPTFLAGALILLFWIADAVLWPAIAPDDPQKIFPVTLAHPFSPGHLLGTDNLGRDVLSRMLAGASTVLTVAPAATALGLVCGIVVGLVTGYYRGVLDDIVMRGVDAVLAFPLVIIAVLTVTVIGSSQFDVIVLIAATFTPLVARTVRAAVMTQRDLEYVAAARLAGESGPRVMFTEILPNILGPIVVEGTVRLGYAIFTSATLSFLTLGIQQPSPDWGLTISLGQVYLQVAPWIVLVPALALATLVVAVNLVADGFAQVLKA